MPIYYAHIKQLRKQDAKLPPDYDLCAKHSGVYADVVLASDGRWTAYAINVPVSREETRTQAINTLEKLQSPKSSLAEKP